MTDTLSTTTTTTTTPQLLVPYIAVHDATAALALVRRRARRRRDGALRRRRRPNRSRRDDHPRCTHHAVRRLPRDRRRRRRTATRDRRVHCTSRSPTSTPSTPRPSPPVRRRCVNQKTSRTAHGCRRCSTRSAIAGCSARRSPSPTAAEIDAAMTDFTVIEAAPALAGSTGGSAPDPVGVLHDPHRRHRQGGDVLLAGARLGGRPRLGPRQQL